MTSSGTVIVPADLVGHVRAGVKRELRESLVTLHDEMDTEQTDAEVYSQARARYRLAAGILDALGLNDETNQAEIELPLEPWSRELLGALESQLDMERTRLDRAKGQGLDLSREHLPGLAELVEEVRRRSGQPARAVRDASRQDQLRHPRLRPCGDE